MKAYVITILDHPKSVQSADRCIKSAAKNGLEVHKWQAYTPKDNPIEILESKGIDPSNFQEVYSRWLNCAAAFCSHFSLWEECVARNEKIVIFEHDAVIHGSIPVDIHFNKVMTFSEPSYGKYNTPQNFGVNALTQKKYFGGAHGYIVKPAGAKELIEHAKKEAKPTDVYLNVENFPWLQEYYPWVCKAMDNFTTIQNINGCQAKHRYGETYALEEVR